MLSIQSVPENLVRKGLRAPFIESLIRLNWHKSPIAGCNQRKLVFINEIFRGEFECRTDLSPNLVLFDWA
jgi:hypothetical protein